MHIHNPSFFHVCICIYVCMYVYVYIYIYIYIYIYNMYTYTYTHKCTSHRHTGRIYSQYAGQPWQCMYTSACLACASQPSPLRARMSRSHFTYTLQTKRRNQAKRMLGLVCWVPHHYVMSFNLSCYRKCFSESSAVRKQMYCIVFFVCECAGINEMHTCHRLRTSYRRCPRALLLQRGKHDQG